MESARTGISRSSLLGRERSGSRGEKPSVSRGSPKGEGPESGRETTAVLAKTFSLKDSSQNTVEKKNLPIRKAGIPAPKTACPLEKGIAHTEKKEEKRAVPRVSRGDGESFQWKKKGRARLATGFPPQQRRNNLKKKGEGRRRPPGGKEEQIL